MYNYDKNYIAKRATELGFIRDTLEKVYRLADILEYLNTNPILKDSLALNVITKAFVDSIGYYWKSKDLKNDKLLLFQI